MTLQTKQPRRGAIINLMAILLIPFVAMLAFAVDYGFLLRTRADLQRSADAAALAAVQDLVPYTDRSSQLESVRSTARSYVQQNLDSSFQVRDEDIEIGRYDPDTIYEKVELLNDGSYDTVRVTLRRDDLANGSVALFFAPAIGMRRAPVVARATAVLQKSSAIPPGSAVLPFAIPKNVWDTRDLGDSWVAYSDGKLKDSNGSDIPGNWGTLDIGSSANATSDLNDQMVNGLKQEHLDALYQGDRISSNEFIDSGEQIWLNGDPGLSGGVQNALEAIRGQTRLAPIYDLMGGDLNGGSLEFRVVAWGVVTVVDSSLSSSSKYVRIQKARLFDGKLYPQSDLSNTANVVDGAFTAPALVE